MPLSDAAGYPVWANALIFLAAAAVVWISGGRLTRHLDAIAAKTGMEQVFVGMLLLGGITSLPEVANTVTASSIGNPALAVNNLLGSAAINVLLLAVVDGFVGRAAVTSIVARPSTMMMAALCMIVLILIAAIITVGDVMIPGIGVGVGSLAVGAAAIFSFWLAAGHDRRSPWSVDEDGDGRPDAEEAEGQVEPDLTLAGLWWRVALDGALIFAAGYALSQTGDAIATQAGLTSAIVGFALIGAATSLPELVTIVAALKLGRPEMAFGQVLGTNFVNLALLPLGDAVFRGPPLMETLGSFETVSALLGATLIGVFMVGLLEHRDRTIWKMGVDSAVVILIFAAGSAVLAMI
ncbi:sodium:calcium antiporter [Sphingomonas corticis]|jgi:cation:H+ antiporter|uniref:Sodium:calcium antiporter n=1 Tax=Sphingomonas corticis TaxID=2722791 RepID=A0ABX1CPD3_9SPHN|nr:sodium:calcium antiporter [Sphingomonas corticis]NJR78686.1 sodium:calcium antiporter [Sphingomonas corticis]